jgi:hypothetical protein
MLVNYPLECWDVDTIVTTMAPYGRFLVWNRQDSNKARIFVKIRAYDVNKIPGSIVVIQSTNSIGHGNSWSCPCVLFNMNMIGAGPGDEDHLLPNGANPHPLPLVFDDFDLWHAQNDNIPAVSIDDAPAEPAAGEPILMTLGNNPVHGAHDPAADPLIYHVGDPVDGEGSANNVARPAAPADDLTNGEGAPIIDAHPAAPAVVSAEASAESGGNSILAAPLAENVASDHAAVNNAAFENLGVPAADYQTSHIHAVHHMIANIIGSVNDVLPTLSNSNIVGATCKMVTVETEAGLQDKSFL